jgi:hypothetical protein
MKIYNKYTCEAILEDAPGWQKFNISSDKIFGQNKILLNMFVFKIFICIFCSVTDKNKMLLCTIIDSNALFMQLGKY